MPVCTFFGHADCPESIAGPLRKALERLVKDENVDLFYVGDSGRFDAIVRRELQMLKERHGIKYAVVLARMPGRRPGAEAPPLDTIFPEELETVPARFAIDRRNAWMLKRAAFVVTYVTHSWGGAAKFEAMAVKLGKRVIRL